MNHYLPGNSLKGYYAGFVSRFLAFVIDILVVTLIVLFINVSTIAVLSFFQIDLAKLTAMDTPGTKALAIFLGILNISAVIFVWVFYYVIGWSLVGQTIGKRMLGLRVMSYDGQGLTLKQALLRYFGYWLSAFPFFLGYIWVLVDDERLGWHDKIAHTCVIYSWDARRGPWLQKKLEEAQMIETERSKIAGKISRQSIKEG